jgi:hypothetical protein
VSIDWTNNDEFNASAEKMHDAITSLQQAIAELESQEPSAWVGLTDEEVNNAIKEKNITPLFTYRMIARTIEAKLKERNNA